MKRVFPFLLLSIVIALTVGLTGFALMYRGRTTLKAEAETEPIEEI